MNRLIVNEAVNNNNSVAVMNLNISWRFNLLKDVDDSLLSHASTATKNLENYNQKSRKSQSKSIKVSVCWNALSKIIKYFYSGKFPVIQIGCILKNMNVNQQL